MKTGVDACHPPSNVNEYDRDYDHDVGYYERYCCSSPRNSSVEMGMWYLQLNWASAEQMN